MEYDYGYECQHCGSTERRETDIERRGVYLEYHYICTECGECWIVTEKQEV